MKIIFRLVLLFLLLAVGAVTQAHDLRFVKAEMFFDMDARTYELLIHYDIDSLIVDVDPYHMTDEEFEILSKMPGDKIAEALKKIEALMDRSVLINFDTRRARSGISFPDYAEGRPDRPFGGSGYYLEHTRRIVFKGDIPGGAERFTLTTKEMGNCALLIQQSASTIEVRHALAPNATSPPYSLTTPPQEASAGQVIWQFAYLGFEHIIPEGIDHVLFVLGLFLLAAQLGPLFWQITAFTLAHSLTLLLAINDMIAINGEIVEAVVALSIAYVAIENLFTKEMHWWRPVVVFVFGLLHGMGFAGGLKEIGLPDNHFALALVSFNIGVEIGHLAVVGVAFLLIGWFREKPWYRQRIVYPISGAIALVAVIWAVQRFGALLLG